MTSLELQMRECADLIESDLAALVSEAGTDYPKLYEAMRYSLLSGGKRIRPFLTLQFSRLFNGDPTVARRLACAVEMIHTYSLIHDDLPCMDDDDLRRGRPTNHKVFGEAVAVLAGDALLTEAFGVIAHPSIPTQTVIHAVYLLSQSAGTVGMIGGQMLDMIGETEALRFETLLQMHKKKTGAIIVASALFGCFSAGIFDEDDPRYRAAYEYASSIGLAFQIVDDCLDAIGDPEQLGKPVGSDNENQKTTFLTFMSCDEAMAYAHKLTDHAKDAISMLDNHDILTAFADYLIARKK